MQGVTRHIFFLIICIFLQIIVGSCSSSEPSTTPLPANGPVQLSIHISPVSSRAMNNSGNSESKEMIKSMHIIMIGTDTETGKDTVEFNKFIEVKIPGGIPATDFQYDFLWRTKEGKKTFFMIANEESVSGMSYSDNTLPVETPTTISDLLGEYQDGQPADNLIKILQGAYFSPGYEASSEGNVFLPYTSVYSIDIAGEKDYMELSMYMIPVAAKFIFNFTNHRDAAVLVEGISLNYVNTSNYLLGNVGEADSIKKIDEKSYYWVDWLAEISQLSWQNSGYYPNMGFNEKYGWITNYSIPKEDYIEEIFVEEGEKFEVGELTENQEDPTQPIPGSYIAGPFYVPESRNFLNPETEESTDTQTYYLTIIFTDTAEGKDAPEFVNVAISNLQALFRNTFVIINIDMSQGDVEVYAEIADWNYNYIRGWVTEGQNPGLGI